MKARWILLSLTLVSVSVAFGQDTISELDGARQTIARMKADSTQMANHIASLKAELADAKRKYEAYEAAFDEIKEAIQKGYANASLPITEMSNESLNAAVEKFKATEDLLKTNEVLYKDLKPKAEQMEAWIGMKIVLDMAVEYMKGKYDDTERKRLIDDIDKEFKGKPLGEAQEKEKNDIRKALENQVGAHGDFVEILKFIRTKKALSSQKLIDEAKEIIRQKRRGKELNGLWLPYHVSYHNALDELTRELDKGETNPIISDDAELAKFLSKLESQF